MHAQSFTVTQDALMRCEIKSLHRALRCALQQFPELLRVERRVRAICQGHSPVSDRYALRRASAHYARVAVTGKGRAFFERLGVTVPF
jgi:hypothetical protein